MLRLQNHSKWLINLEYAKGNVSCLLQSDICPSKYGERRSIYINKAGFVALYAYMKKLAAPTIFECAENNSRHELNPQLVPL